MSIRCRCNRPGPDRTGPDRTGPDRTGVRTGPCLPVSVHEKRHAREDSDVPVEAVCRPDAALGCSRDSDPIPERIAGDSRERLRALRIGGARSESAEYSKSKSEREALRNDHWIVSVVAHIF